MKKLLALMMALVMVLAVAACGKTETVAEETTEETVEEVVDLSAKSEGSMTYAEYMAADMDSDVVIEGYITAKAYAQAWGNVGLMLQDGDGAYYVYRMPCDDALDAQLVLGQKVQITGVKTEWSGEVEIKEGTGSCVVLEDNHTFEATDVTAVLGTDDESKYMNMFVSVEGATVTAAPLYNWDGSGAEGDDIYVGLQVNGTDYTFLVETDLYGAGTDVYEAAKALAVGDTVNLEGFLYWYNAPQMWMTSISK